MVTKTTTIVPSLEKPGAGLPWWELLVARYLIFPRTCRRLTWRTAAELFQVEGAAVLKLWDSLPSEFLTQRVLIRRIVGIEDSSRYWSVAMTVEHLNIVGFGIRELIAGLRRGDEKLPVARIQDVKPMGIMAPDEIRATFRRLLDEAATSARIESPIAPGTGAKAAHPWFGMIDAFQWHCLLGMHQQIHRRQIERICESLRGTKT